MVVLNARTRVVSRLLLLLLDNMLLLLLVWSAETRGLYPAPGIMGVDMLTHARVMDMVGVVLLGVGVLLVVHWGAGSGYSAVIVRISRDPPTIVLTGWWEFGVEVVGIIVCEEGTHDD